MEAKRLESLKQIAAGIAAQFGDKCEVVIHDVSGSHPDHTIVHIENGHVSGRKVGDGASQVVLDQFRSQNDHPKDHLCYLTRTPDGKLLKSSSIYIRNSRGNVTSIFSINYDITNIMMMHQELGEFMMTRDKEQTEPEKIVCGGPMMGIPLFKLDIPVAKNSSSILAFAHDQVSRRSGKSKGRP